MNMRFVKNIILFVFCCFMSACGDDYQWTEDAAKLTNKDLNGWLQKAPFEGDINKDEDRKILMTNAEQLFPFKGQYINADGEVPHQNIYQSANVLFNDPKWGSVYVLATLLHTPEKLYYKDSHYSAGNMMFGDSLSANYDAHLSETQVATVKPDYQTVIYRASVDTQSYLFATYQKGVLLFEVVIPWQDDAAVIAKLKEVNQALNLNIPEWNKLTAEDLTVNEKPVTFWKDPYVGMFKFRLNYRLSLKTGMTPFDVEDGERLYYRTEKGDVVMQFEEVQTPLNQADYFANPPSAPITYVARGYYGTTEQTVYVSEKEQDGKVLGEGETFFQALIQY